MDHARVPAEEEAQRMQLYLDALRHNSDPDSASVMFYQEYYIAALERNSVSSAEQEETTEQSEQGTPASLSNLGHIPFSTAHLTRAARAQIFIDMATRRGGTSKLVLERLEPVELEELPEDDRTCTICYNDYFAQSPEGLAEQPTRIPGCRHVFGDRCLRSWLADANTCPYCRAPLLENGQAAMAQLFLSISRIRDGTEGSATPEDLVQRLVAGEDIAPLVRRSPAARRPLPDNDDDDRLPRRTRQRRSSPPAIDLARPLATQSRARPSRRARSTPFYAEIRSMHRQSQSRRLQDSTGSLGEASPTRIRVSSRPQTSVSSTPHVQNAPSQYQPRSHVSRHPAAQQEQHASSNSPGQASMMQTGFLTASWVSTVSAPQGPVGSILHNAPLQYQSPNRAGRHLATLQQQLQASPNSRGQASTMQSGLATTSWVSTGSAPSGPPASIVQGAPLQHQPLGPWHSMAFAPPGPPRSVGQSAPLRYQSPARPAQATAVQPPNWPVYPPMRGQDMLTTNVSTATTWGAMPNPLHYSLQAAQMPHGTLTATTVSPPAYTPYAAPTGTTRTNPHGYIEDMHPREPGFI